MAAAVWAARAAAAAAAGAWAAAPAAAGARAAVRRVATTAVQQQHRGSFDFRQIREHAGDIARDIERRKADGDVHRVVALYNEYCAMTEALQQLRAARNDSAAKFAQALQAKADKAQLAELQAQAKALKAQAATMEAQYAQLVVDMNSAASRLPNRIHPAVPDGTPTVVRMHGAQPEYDFSPLDHLQLNERLGFVELEAAARASGSRFYYLTGYGALLEMALIQFSLHRATQRGFLPVTTPDIVQRDVAEACGYQPRGEASQTYLIGSDANGAKGTLEQCLVGTSEMAVAAMHMGEILPTERLPIKVVAFSHCFRREARGGERIQTQTGGHGSETRGLYRVHQFSKVELFAFTTPEQSDSMLEQVVDLQESMFRDLGLHYKLLDMTADDLGASAYRKFDIEAWMPGRRAYGEISSASNCTDYQSRRLNIRYRPGPTLSTAQGSGDAAPMAVGAAAVGASSHLPFVHTINGTACAVPRMIIALLETHQRADGSVHLPKALEPYLGACPRILTPRR